MDEREAAQIFDIIRSEIKHEDDLIGQRVSWFTASQAIPAHSELQTTWA